MQIDIPNMFFLPKSVVWENFVGTFMEIGDFYSDIIPLKWDIFCLGSSWKYDDIYIYILM